MISELNRQKIQCEIQRALLDTIKRRQFKQTYVAAQAGIPYQTLHRMLHSRSPLYLVDALAVCKVIGIQLEDVLPEELK